MVNNWVRMHTEQPTAVLLKVLTGRLFFPVVCLRLRGGRRPQDCRRDKWGDEDPNSANGSSALPPPSPPPPCPPPHLNTLLFLTPSLCSGWTERSGENTKTGRIKEHLSSHLQPVCYRTTKSISLYGISDYLVLTGGEDNWEEGQKWITSEIDLTWVDSLHKVRSTFLLDCLQPLTYLNSRTTE